MINQKIKFELGDDFIHNTDFLLVSFHLLICLITDIS